MEDRLRQGERETEREGGLRNGETEEGDEEVEAGGRERWRGIEKGMKVGDLCGVEVNTVTLWYVQVAVNATAGSSLAGRSTAECPGAPWEGSQGPTGMYNKLPVSLCLCPFLFVSPSLCLSISLCPLSFFSSLSYPVVCASCFPVVDWSSRKSSICLVVTSVVGAVQRHVCRGCVYVRPPGA